MKAARDGRDHCQAYRDEEDSTKIGRRHDRSCVALLEFCASDLAAGIGYRVLFALAPLTVALVSVFGLPLQNEELKHDVIDRIVSALPVNSQNVTGAIGNIATPASAAGLVSLLVLGWAASGMMTAIRFGLERTMSVEEDRGVAHGKLVDLRAVAETVVLVLASVGVGLVTQVASGLVAEVAGAAGLQETATTTVVTKLLQLLLWTGTVLLVFRVVPAKRPPLADALAGAVVTALLLLVVSLAAGFLYSHATKWSFIYGSLTSVFVFLYSVYLFASAVLFGAAVATEWFLPHPPDPESRSPRRAAGSAHACARMRGRGRTSPAVGGEPENPAAEAGSGSLRVPRRLPLSSAEPRPVLPPGAVTASAATTDLDLLPASSARRIRTSRMRSATSGSRPALRRIAGMTEMNRRTRYRRAIQARRLR